MTIKKFLFSSTLSNPKKAIWSESLSAPIQNDSIKPESSQRETLDCIVDIDCGVKQLKLWKLGRWSFEMIRGWERTVGKLTCVVKGKRKAVSKWGSEAARNRGLNVWVKLYLRVPEARGFDNFKLNKPTLADSTFSTETHPRVSEWKFTNFWINSLFTRPG